MEPPAAEVRKGPSVRQSVPGYGGKTRLGGKSSYAAMLPPGTVQRMQRQIADFEAERKAEDMHMRIFQAAVDHRCSEIDRDADAKCSMEPPVLADYAMELAKKIMDPDPLRS